MTRRNLQVEALEREIAILRRIDSERRKDPGDLPVTGCGDNSCIVARPSGMATNGGCRCDIHKVRSAMNYWRRRAQFLEETIRIMKTAEGERVPEDD